MKYEPIYDRKYLGLCLEVIKDDLDEIIKWSVRNGDKCLDEIIDIENKLKELKKKLYDDTNLWTGKGNYKTGIK